MQNLINDFLTQKHIAIVGVTRDEKGWGRTLYDEFKKHGYDVYAINPASNLPGIQSYVSLHDLPTQVDGVLLSVPPNVTDQVVHEVAALGIPRVWMHKGVGAGAVSEPAIDFCKKNGIAVVYGVCPFMYLKPQGFGHKMHYTFSKWFGGLPKGA